MPTPETAVFADDGKIPNNLLPALLYRGAMAADTEKDLASQIEQVFATNDWSGSWRNGVYSYHHFHSITHEVLGVFSGTATLQLGGENGKTFEVQAGDVVVIPAGVGHKNVKCSSDFAVVGAYPGGSERDFMTGEPGERPQADLNIAAAAFPKCDPVFGEVGPLVEIWKNIQQTSQN